MSPTKNILLSCKKELIDIYKHAVDGVKPEKLINHYMWFEGDDLVVRRNYDESSMTEFEKSWNRTYYDIKRSKIHVVGGGKSVLGMAAALGDLVNRASMHEKFSHGAISVPIGLKTSFDDITQGQLDSIKVKCLFGSKNNLPDEESVAATKYILDNIKYACQSDRKDQLEPLFIVLISGGGSACLTSPRYLKLSEKLNLIRQLVQKGADIVELNTVRRFYSYVKGGNLARYILNCKPGSQILTLILSDVIGDPIEFIASGPTFVNKDDSTKEAMHKVLEKYNLTLPSIDFLEPTFLEPSDWDYTKKCYTNDIIIGNNDIALNCAMKRAKCLGYRVFKLDAKLEGSTSEAVQKLLSFSRANNRGTKLGKILFIAGGETTVKLQSDESWGIGGRLQEFCLDYMINGLSALDNKHCRDNECGDIDLLLAGSTDGQDGPTDVAACMASLTEHELTVEDDNQLKFNLTDCFKAKKMHSTYDFWTKYQHDWLLKTGLTGTNVMDIFLYMKAAGCAKNDSN